MRAASKLFGQLTGGTRSQRLIVDVFYDDEPVMRDLPVTDWDLSWDIAGGTIASGGLTVAYQGDTADSLSPRGFLDALAPYGQQVNVLIEVSLDETVETVQLGRFRITEAPDATDQYMAFLGRTMSVGSLVKLELGDLLTAVKRDGFHWPEPPLLTASTWDELQRISGLPVAPSLPDRPTPSGVIYQPKEGARLTAVQMLASWLGGVAVTNSFGELTVVPFDAGPVALELATGPEGQVLSASSQLDSERLYNVVVGTYAEDDGTPIYETSPAVPGPLGAAAPFGEYTYYDQSDTVTTQAGAAIRVRQVLAQLQRGAVYQITLSCVADYRLEIGDVASFRSLTGHVTGRASSVQFTDDGLMEVVLDVRRDVGA